MSLNSILKLWNSYPFMKIYLFHMTLKIEVHSDNILHFLSPGPQVLPYTKTYWLSVVLVSVFPSPICQLKMLAFTVVDNFRVAYLAQFWLLINLL